MPRERYPIKEMRSRATLSAVRYNFTGMACMWSRSCPCLYWYTRDEAMRKGHAVCRIIRKCLENAVTFVYLATTSFQGMEVGQTPWSHRTSGIGVCQAQSTVANRLICKGRGVGERVGGARTEWSASTMSRPSSREDRLSTVQRNDGNEPVCAVTEVCLVCVPLVAIHRDHSLTGNAWLRTYPGGLPE